LTVADEVDTLLFHFDFLWLKFFRGNDVKFAIELEAAAAQETL
jgi:hypothetical protein